MGTHLPTAADPRPAPVPRRRGGGTGLGDDFLPQTALRIRHKSKVRGRTLWAFGAALLVQPLAVLWTVAGSGSSTQLWLGLASWCALLISAGVYRERSMPLWSAAKHSWSRWKAPVMDPRWLGIQPLLHRLQLESDGRPSLQRDVAEIARATYRLAAGREALLRSAAVMSDAGSSVLMGGAQARIASGAQQLDAVLDQLCGALADLQVALAVPDGFKISGMHAHIQDALERAQAALEVHHLGAEAPIQAAPCVVPEPRAGAQAEPGSQAEVAPLLAMAK